MPYYLIRHGETTWNKDNRIQGWTDISLSEKGLIQANLLAEELMRDRFDAVYTSDLARSFETAMAFAKRSQMQPMKDPLLREIHFGTWEGKTWQQIVDENKDAYASGLYDHPDARTHGGESMRMFKDRVNRHFKEIVLRHRNEHVLMFTHGGNIRMILLDILGLEIDFKNHVAIDNASITIVDLDASGKQILRSVNDTRHLAKWNLG